MSELPKTYEPGAVESKWYARWDEAGCFRADAHSPKPAFSIVIPPPNITGILTLGHVLNNTIQDILARRARMQGCEVLWLPGTDHAGVGTQTAVEKHLRKTEKKTRHDLGREEFLRRVLEWQDKHGGIIIEQLKRLGCSCDWSRQRYTFDDDYVRAVERVFVDLYGKGLIYRGRRMINWDPAAQTALSDEEVIAKPQKGKLYYVRYEIVEEPGRYLEVATTRPETIMADTAVAVHPDDPRYAGLIGKNAWRPLAREKLPIIGDAVIDPKFGTGVLKVTPAHDKIDFEIGVRHSLPVIDVLDPAGRITCPAVPELDGLDRFAAREKAAEMLRERGLLAKEEPYENNVGFAERSDVPIEPRLSEQWFLRYPKTKEALAVVRDHLIRFFPAHWEKVYAQWLENIQDWCISRQIWWGHRIPAWYRKSQIPEPKSQTAEDIYVGVEPPGDSENWTQDPDTLDTWFSSWLWAYETMDDETRRKFYPTSVLVTAPDIIFFWVARMIIAGLEFKPGQTSAIEDNIPFRDVFFTGLIRDKQGRKMSKSLGNSPDPLDLIAKYGADGLRFGLMRIAPSGQDIAFDEKQIEEGRNFATKLWNAARFRQMHGPSEAAPRLETHALSIYALEVLARFDELLVSTEAAFREYKFNEVAQRLYEFFWSDYCDWFIESAKTEIFSEDEGRKKSVLAVMDFVLSGFLRLLHPFMPHITEELWSVFGFGGEGGDIRSSSIQFAPSPAPALASFETKSVAEARSKVANVYETILAGRNLRATSRIPSNKKARFILRAAAGADEQELPTISRLLNAEELTLDPAYQPEAGVPVAMTPLGELHLIIEGGDKSAERDRLDKEIAKLENELRVVGAKLSNAFFVDKAPPAVVEEHRQRQADFSEQLTQLRKARAAMD
jgi:valyl-tRNA synthetase